VREAARHSQRPEIVAPPTCVPPGWTQGLSEELVPIWLPGLSDSHWLQGIEQYRLIECMPQNSRGRIRQECSCDLSVL